MNICNFTLISSLLCSHILTDGRRKREIYKKMIFTSFSLSLDRNKVRVDFAHADYCHGREKRWHWYVFSPNVLWRSYISVQEHGKTLVFFFKRCVIECCIQITRPNFYSFFLNSNRPLILNMCAIVLFPAKKKN
jgi:hypothetical protein